MVVQDSLTGALHEVPDYGMGEVVYDGFGNPVGLFPGIMSAVRGLFRGPTPPSPSAVLSQLVRPGVPLRQCGPPIGWTTPALPYTGRAPRRLYMRCSVWPGPAGLVPAHAATGVASGVPGFPGFPGAPGMPGMPGAPGVPAFARRRRRFRRRR